jgi:hypothetical protein
LRARAGRISADKGVRCVLPPLDTPDAPIAEIAM